MITFLGDTALLTDGLKSKYKPESPYILNFEYVTGKKKFSPTVGKINLYSSICDFETVFGKKPLAVVVANNHIFDFGQEGFQETLNMLHEQHISTVGNREFWINESVCILAYSLIPNIYDRLNTVSFDKEKALADFQKVRHRGAKQILVNMHWGVENHPMYTEQQQKIGRWLIDNGVDLVIGHHPHCIQPAEKYKGKYIFYSLGNCLFPNFNVASHYNESGKPTRKYRFKWQCWNRTSIAVCYDENSQNVFVNELYQKKDTLLCKRQHINPDKFAGLSKAKTANIQYLFRKYFLFFISNLFTDGKLFDVNAIRAERQKK